MENSTITNRHPRRPSISTRAFFRGSFALPLVLPLFAMLLLLSMGEVNPEGMAGISMFVLLSGIIGGIPYLLLMVRFIYWSKNKAVRKLRQFTYVAPLLFAVLLITILFMYASVINNVPSKENMEYSLLLGGYGVVVGYAYVIGVHALYWVFRWLKFVRD